MLGLGPISSSPIAATLTTGDLIGVLVGSMFFTLAMAGDVSGDGVLAGSTPMSLTPEGTLHGNGALAGAAPVALACSGELVGNGDLAGAASFALTPSGVLFGTGELAGSTPFALTCTGAIFGEAALAGQFSLQLDTSGVLIGVGDLDGALALNLEFVGFIHRGAPRQIRFRLQFAREQTRIAIACSERVRVRLLDAAPARAIVRIVPRTDVRVKPAAPRLRVLFPLEAALLNIGDVAQLDMECYVNNVLVDPATVTLIVKPPGADAEELTYVFGPEEGAIVKIATAKYRGLVQCTAAGIWRGRWVLTGSAQGVEEFSFSVAANTF